MNDIINSLEKREDFKEIKDYIFSKKTLIIYSDSPEEYFINEANDVLLNLPTGKEWTMSGLSSVDISLEWFPNLFSKKGIETFSKAFYYWLIDIIKDPKDAWSWHPFQTWHHWQFVLDSKESLCSEIIAKKFNYEYNLINQNKNYKVTEEELLEELNRNYFKVNKYLYSLKTDPTQIISLYHHDKRDGYSFEKIEEILTEWIRSIYKISELKVIMK